MYFSEVTELDSTQTRSFEIYIDGKSHFDPIVPAYGSVVEMSITNISASSNTSFSLVATSDSTLPPLINVMEVYYVSGPITDGTDSKDVAGLATLQDKFSTLQEWTGDPCLPSSFTWDWVNCSADDTPRVTALYLSGFGLSGQLPEFSSLDALQTIDLHNNSLSGSIPDFLCTLPNLKQLVCSMSQSKRRRAAALAATNAGQNGGANMPNGLSPQGAPMNPQTMGKFGEVMMNQFAGKDEDRETPKQGTPEQIRNQQVEERPLQY
ncbi:PREDICTED: probable LRR receptor [Prunus dulcis]|uniref:PREDICTED: probable LRR receptor n=1 Tax=Prunus dulcis TaxID=3755 RepID=A0A5E4EYE2_PRUDU|nr:PREDICTED: probable LRR receptor [Prunus dulcis]